MVVVSLGCLLDTPLQMLARHFQRVLLRSLVYFSAYCPHKLKMQRLIALDTETTGLNRRRRGAVCDGHRIIEIGCVEIVNGELTGREFHRYVNPERSVDPKATAVHGITDRFLKGKRTFNAVASDLLSFIRGADILIHNAPFDIAFLDKEFELLDAGSQPREEVFTVIDTLDMARGMFPGERNSLDALCRRYGIGGRKLHGALSDAIILAKVYIRMRHTSHSHIQCTSHGTW
jgi:DNA polymerase-3 subunit epsilon